MAKGARKRARRFPLTVPAIAQPTSSRVSSLSESRKFHDLPACERRFMGAEADASPVGGLDRIRVRIAILEQRGDKFVRQVRM